MACRRALEQGTLGTAAAAIVAIPYATLSLPYRLALYAQAAGILAVILIVFGLGVPRPGTRQRIRDCPRGLLAGLGLYTGAALLGAAVALVNHNAFPQIAGQLLSMLLLPLAALAALALPGDHQEWSFTSGLVAAVSIASLAHLATWTTSLSSHDWLHRWYLANDVGVAGSCLLALLGALWMARFGGRFWHATALPAIALISLYIVGSGVRGLWLLAPVAFLLGWGFIGGGSRRLWRTLLVPGFLVVLAGAGTAAMVAWANRNLPNIAPSTSPPGLYFQTADSSPARKSTSELRQRVHCTREHHLWALSEPFLLPAPGTYRLSSNLDHHRPPVGRLLLQWLDASNHQIAVTELSESVALVPSPTHARTARILTVCDGTPGSGWSLQDIRMSRVGGLWISSLDAYFEFLRARWISTRQVFRRQQPSDPSIMNRLEESRVLLEDYKKGGILAKLLGRGLGATYTVSLSGPDAGESPVDVERLNYIHNFYLFLLYKLGALGFLAVGAALTLFVAVSLQAARSPASPAKGFATAASIAWFAYLVWSISSPEILDFRIAPLWGFLLACTARLPPSRTTVSTPS